MVFKEDAYLEVFPKQVEKPLPIKKESMINDEPDENTEDVKHTEDVIDNNERIVPIDIDQVDQVDEGENNNEL